MTSETIRLNKLLALQLGVSRREADVLIETQVVTVNGKTAQLGAHISDSDIITVSGTTIPTHKVPYIYLAFYKPVGFVCSRKSQGDAPTIYTKIPEKYHILKPVGVSFNDLPSRVMVCSSIFKDSLPISILCPK